MKTPTLLRRLLPVSFVIIRVVSMNGRLFNKLDAYHLAMMILAAGFGYGLPPATASEAEWHYSVTRFGAVGDGRTRNTLAVQKAIDTGAAAGGGTVFFPAGRFLCGTLVLKNHVTLHLDNGAVLLGSTDINDYQRHRPAYRSYSDNYVNTALLYAEGAHDIGIVGAGTIDGQGGDPAFACKHPNYRFLERPYLIRFVECTNVRVAGVTLRDSAMWVQHYLACDNVVLERLTVLSNCNNNNDMMDIDGCRDVRVFGCTGESGDDAITLKSTGPRACERVTISDCTVSSHCSGIKLGTESTGGFRDIAINNCVIRRPVLPGHLTNTPEGIGLEMVDGGTLERVTMSNITMEGVQAPLLLRLGNRARKHAPDAPAPPIGKFRDVFISNFIARGAGHFGCAFSGLEGAPIENVTLRDVRITFNGGGTREDAGRQVPELPAAYPSSTMFGKLPAYGFYVRHVSNLTLDNVQVDWEKPDRRPAIVCDDARNLRIHNLQAASARDGAGVIQMNDVDTALISGCVAPEIAGGFVSVRGKIRAISIIGNDLSREADAVSNPDPLQQRELFLDGNRMPSRGN
jgi:hypothetical protein